ncbi:MAG: oligosaccharide flippase family protein [Microcoleaceae cyanobacterium]
MSSIKNSIKNQALKGTLWTLLGYGGSQVLRLGGNLILTRLLVPELFGLMALVQTFITGLTLFSDIGIRPSIIRSSRWQEEQFLNTAWTMQVLRGSWIWLGCLIVALPASRFYDEPKLLWLLPLVALGAWINGFASTSLATLNRKLEIDKITKLEFITQTISLTVMVAWASILPSIWALVIGNLVAASVKTLWSHRLEAGHNRFTWDKSAVKEIMTFGSWVFVSTVMLFLASQSDRLVLGKLFPLELLGVYTVAYTLSDLPRQIVVRVSSQVMFPVMSKYAHIDRQEFRARILKKRWLILIGLAFLVTGLAASGDIVINILYSEEYSSASWMLPVLAVGLWPLLLSYTINKALFAIDKPFYLAIGNFLKFIYMVTLTPFVFAKTGVLGAVTVVAFNDILPYSVVAFGLVREGLSTLWQDFTATGLLLVLLATVLFARYTLGYGFPVSNIL